MNNLDILFDAIDDEEFEVRPSGENHDIADSISNVCPCCLNTNGNHDFDCLVWSE